MKKVFILNGSGGVGKDTFVSLVGILAVPVTHLSSITPAKELAKQIEWSGGKTEKDRKFLSDLKDLMTEYNDYPLQYLKKQVDFFLHDQDHYQVCFIDIREPREIEKAAKAFNATTVLVTAEGRVDPISTNHADDGVYDYQYDFYVDNSGTIDDLKDAVVGFCTQFGIPIKEGV